MPIQSRVRYFAPILVLLMLVCLVTTPPASTLAEGAANPSATPSSSVTTTASANTIPSSAPPSSGGLAPSAINVCGMVTGFIAPNSPYGAGLIAVDGRTIILPPWINLGFSVILPGSQVAVNGTVDANNILTSGTVLPGPCLQVPLSSGVLPPVAPSASPTVGTPIGVVQIQAPPDGATVSDRVTLAGYAADCPSGAPAQRVRIFLGGANGTLLGTATLGSLAMGAGSPNFTVLCSNGLGSQGPVGWTFPLETAQLPNGSTLISAVAEVSSGTVVDTVTYQVANVAAPPTPTPTPTAVPTPVTLLVTPVVSVLKNPNAAGGIAAGTCPSAGPCTVQFSWTEPVPATNTLSYGVGAPGSGFALGSQVIPASANPTIQVSFNAAAGQMVHFQATSSIGGVSLQAPDTGLTL